MTIELTERTSASVRRAVAEAIDQLSLAQGYLVHTEHVGAALALAGTVDELENLRARFEVLNDTEMKSQLELIAEDGKSLPGGDT